MANSLLTSSGFVFSRSLKKISMSFPSAGTPGPKGGRLSITLGDAPDFEGRFFPPLSVDISGWIDATVPLFPDLWPTGEPIIYADDFETTGFEGRTMVIKGEYGDSEISHEAVVIPGGLSTRSFSRISESGKDIFTERFLNPRNNFFLTTRTEGWRIVIKETELFPLYFIFEKPKEMEVRELISGSFQSFHLPAGIFALDLEALRTKFVMVNKVFPSMFDVYVDGYYSCRIVIERAAPAKERYRLLYRSSFGIPEMIELTGSLTLAPSFESSEDYSFSRPGQDGKNRNYRMRQPMTVKGSVSTGVKRPDELRMILDAVASPEVWLLGYKSFPVRVLPSLESVDLKAAPDQPQELKLTLEMDCEETNISPEIYDSSSGRKPRVFSKQFNDKFN